MEEKKEQVIQLSVLDGLRAFHNTHLEKFLTHKINAIYYSEMKPNDVAKIMMIPSGNPQLPPTRRDIKAKDALTEATKARNHQDHILRIIKRLIKEEK